LIRSCADEDSSPRRDNDNTPHAVTAADYSCRVLNKTTTQQKLHCIAPILFIAILFIAAAANHTNQPFTIPPNM